MDANPPKTSETTPDDNLSPGRVEFWLQLGHDKHRAELIASCSPEYWEHYRGLSHADARVEAARIIDARRHLLPHSWPGQSRILRTDPMHWYFEATATVRHRNYAK